MLQLAVLNAAAFNFSVRVYETEQKRKVTNYCKLMPHFRTGDTNRQIEPALLSLSYKAATGFFFFFFFFLLFRAAPMAFGSSQAKGQIRAVTTGLHRSSFMPTPDP